MIDDAISVQITRQNVNQLVAVQLVSDVVTRFQVVLIISTLNFNVSWSVYFLIMQ